ncbi:hypothetical protein KQQSB11_270038 [Klebsiella quasipneumoniae subsp. quasipneumoniae]|nr:hypothetical protein KQQSB11_270038 [Klebsiella quasipneumoniae subsp. quasipneumoniae]
MKPSLPDSFFAYYLFRTTVYIQVNLKKLHHASDACSVIQRPLYMNAGELWILLQYLM